MKIRADLVSLEQLWDLAGPEDRPLVRRVALALGDGKQPVIEAVRALGGGPDARALTDAYVRTASIHGA